MDDHASDGSTVLEVRGLVSRFGRNVVHEDLDLAVRSGEILGIVGGSGSGKSVLVRTLALLLAPRGGALTVLSQPVTGPDDPQAPALRRRIGMMFQGGALFSGLDVLANVAFPLREHTRLSAGLIQDLARLKLALAGLPAQAASRRPSELSGGMVKRAALARALALDPELVFLDEPTAGLDPVTASAFDELMLDLRESLGLTVVMVTHDLDSLVRVTDRIAFIGERRVLAIGPIEEVAQSEHPQVRNYFAGPRARSARERSRWKDG
ncbi:MAG: ATP-binding cassette domain-containing protein [Ectothiorhodospiraceae bacterium]|nr:ATP-binding cassette domain-containing protein [Chromatiales bacterium]MCP5156919.1 ATP-binding cassette domain-containing protein [Ectothiorhodospiraceae bacterium]